MIQIERFSYLLSSNSAQKRPVITMNTADAHLLLNDIIALQKQLIEAQTTLITALKAAQEPVGQSIEADAGRF